MSQEDCWVPFHPKVLLPFFSTYLSSLVPDRYFIVYLIILTSRLTYDSSSHSTPISLSATDLVLLSKFGKFLKKGSKNLFYPIVLIPKKNT